MPKTSPYFTFVHYYREGEKRRGRNMSLDQAKAEADPIWENLSSTDRERFVEMAEERVRHLPRRRQAPPPPTRMAPYRINMRGIIEKVLAKIGNIRTHPFHIMSFHRESATRLPSEISVLRFSIEKGAECFLHFLLNPEISPGNFKLLSEKLKEKITVIPIEGTSNSKQNLEEVLSAILTFSGGVVFTTSSEAQYAIQVLKELQQSCPGSTNREVIPLDGEELITMLWERSEEGERAQLLHVRENTSNQSGLDSLACEYHKASKNEGVCTLWKTYRLAYSFSQILGKPYNMEVSEGFHRFRANWIPVGTYFSGKGSYEDWKFSTVTSSWDTPGATSWSQTVGGFTTAS